MPNYDQQLIYAKDTMTDAILKASGQNHNMQEVAQAVDSLNAAWDKLTDALVQQRKQMQITITQLHERLADMEMQKRN